MSLKKALEKITVRFTYYSFLALARVISFLALALNL